MWKRVFATVALGFAALLAIGPARDVLRDAGPTTLDSSGFAVVELFTSEGCSSCPAADELLSKLVREYSGAPLYALSFHVDYWDGLGWRDPFGSKAFSERQARYARTLRDDVYTPQAVINGSAQAVGSRELALRALITRALERPGRAGAAPTIELSARAHRDHSIEARHRLIGAPDGAKLSLLVVQTRAHNRVTRGENAERTLQHTNVVRSLEPASASHVTALALPSDLSVQNASIVALLTDPSTLRILAAARADIAEE